MCQTVTMPRNITGLEGLATAMLSIFETWRLAVITPFRKDLETILVAAETNVC